MRLRVSLRYRRAILIYVGTIVVPVALFVWLVFESFEQQRKTLQERTQQQVATLIKEGTDDAVRQAFDDPDHEIIGYAFTIRDGEVVDPMVGEPLPDSPPAAFDEAERLEQTSPQLALAAYRALLAANNHPALALWRIGRCLDRLGKADDARATWRELAAKYPNERDPSHRPFGILAAIAAQDTDGLYERIEDGRWQLSAAQASHFLEQLDATRTSRYLDRFAFARTLNAFPSAGTLGERVIYPHDTESHRIRYRRDGPDGIRGFSINERWIDEVLRPGIESQLDVEGTTAADIRLKVGLLALIVLLLAVGVVLLLRDVSRETRTNQARAELVSSVSHELKTPITLVRLYSETLLRHRDFSEDDRLGFYRIIARESTRLGRLIDQVLTFSRVDRGSQVYHFEEGDITSVVSGVVDDYREYLEHAGFQLCCQLPPAVPAGAVRRRRGIAGAGESARQRRQVFGHRARCRGQRRCGRQQRGDRGGRPRSRHRLHRAGPHLRSLLPRAERDGQRRLRPRPVSGQAHRRGPRRSCRGRERTGPRQPLPSCAPHGDAMPEPRILIVEDEPDLLRGLELNIKAEGFGVLTARRGDEGLEGALRERPDLVLLDVMLPGMSGFDVCRELRRKGFEAPIIILTAKAEEVDRVVGLEIGADDYVTKPFGIRELLARIRVRLRRTSTSGAASMVRFSDVEVDFERQEARRAGARVDLTGKEFDVLRLLAANRGRIVTRDRLLDEVWGYEHYPTTRTVDNHILRLRQKLEHDPSDPRHILSVYGEGYKFVS